MRILGTLLLAGMALTGGVGVVYFYFFVLHKDGAYEDAFTALVVAVLVAAYLMMALAIAAGVHGVRTWLRRRRAR